MRIYSERGQGTTVKIYLPRLAGAPAEVSEQDGSADLPLGENQEVVLVVEDWPAVRQFSVDALSELGYRVLEADGAATALHLLGTHAEIVLLFTDIVMPDVNGAKLAKEARRRRSDLKVLFTTGYTRNAVVHNGVLDPGVELIGKPFTIEELGAKVRSVLDAPAVNTRGEAKMAGELLPNRLGAAHLSLSIIGPNDVAHRLSRCAEPFLAGPQRPLRTLLVGRGRQHRKEEDQERRACHVQGEVLLPEPNGAIHPVGGVLL